MLTGAWPGTPPALFSPETHTWGLDGNHGHPDLFTSKKKTVKHVALHRILKRYFCGVGDLTVVLLRDGRTRCHASAPGLEE